MSISSCRQRQLIESRTTVFPDNRDKKDIVRNIQQKLSLITSHRQNQVKNELQQQLTKRITNLQLSYTEEVKTIEQKVRQLREQLSEVKVMQGEHSKKCELSRRMRKASILQLQKKVQMLLNTESKDRKQIEYRLMSMLEQKAERLLQQLQVQREQRVQDFSLMQSCLEEKLPGLNFAITATNAHLEQQLQRVYKQVVTQIAVLKQTADRRHKQRQLQRKKIMSLMSEVVEQTKQQLQEERRYRQTSKQKLLSLFTTTYSRLSMI